MRSEMIYVQLAFPQAPAQIDAGVWPRNETGRVDGSEYSGRVSKRKGPVHQTERKSKVQQYEC